MSSHSSPNYYNELEDAFMADAEFKVDINEKMKVPNKISFSSEQQNGKHAHFYSDNINMQVPERIVVVGQNQHFGTREAPREIVFDNSLLQNDPYPETPRVATPPRTLTLDRYPFPGLVNLDTQEKTVEKLPVVTKSTQFNLNESVDTLMPYDPHNMSSVGPGGEGLSTSDEVLHLRKQMAKLNRRIMTLEMEHLSRLQKEKVLYGLGIAYFLLKAIVWLNRS